MEQRRTWICHVPMWRETAAGRFWRRKRFSSCIVLRFGILIIIMIRIFRNNPRTGTTNTKDVSNTYQLPSKKQTNPITREGGRTIPCNYHGNCPIGTVCEGMAMERTGRQCQPYLGQKQRWNATSRFQFCIQECLRELTWDEWYFYGYEPNPIETYLALQGHGCVIDYQRIRRNAINRTNLTISLDEWMKGRHHHVIRVDPVIPMNPMKPKNGDLWRALCDDPCQIQTDCRHGLICTSHDGQFKTCQATTRQTKHHDMVIVTGANDKYFKALENFAGSVLYWGPQYPLVVYNLGLAKKQLSKVRTWPNLLALKWSDGIPTSYPDHVRTNLKNFAWKPIIINETVHEYKSIFWLDSGATFVGPIDRIEYIIHQHGLFLSQGQDNPMYNLSHPLTYQWFGRNKEIFGWRPHYAGGIQGHVYPSRYIDTIVVPNAVCALDESCIAPAGSTLMNHRYDQTSLSILAHQEHVQAPHYSDSTTYLRQLLPDNLSQSNRFLIWTARRKCKAYSYMIKRSQNATWNPWNRTAIPNSA